MNQKLGKKILVLGGGGFIGGHLAKKLKDDGNWVRVVDIKTHEYFTPEEMCNEFLTYDLRDPQNVKSGGMLLFEAADRFIHQPRARQASAR